MSSKKKMISVRVDKELASGLDTYLLMKKLKGVQISKSKLFEEMISTLLGTDDAKELLLEARNEKE